MSIVSPNEMEEFYVLDTLDVILNVADTGKNVDVLIELTDNSGTPLISSGIYEDEVTASEMTFPFILSDSTMDGGLYQLYVWLFHDGIQSLASTQIGVNGIPKELLSFWVVTKVSDTKTKVTIYNTEFQDIGTIAFEGDYAGSDINSAKQQFVIAGSHYGDLSAYNTETRELEWHVPIVSNPVQPYFTSVKFNQDLCYVSFWDGQTIGYNQYGNESFQTQGLATVVPTVLHINGNYLNSSGFQRSNISQNWWISSYISGGEVRYSSAIDFNPVGSLNLDGPTTLIFANNNNGILETKIFDAVYNLFSDPYEPFPLPEMTLNCSCEISNDHAVLATGNGIYRYVYQDMIFKIANFPDVHFMNYDEVSKHIWTASGNKLKSMHINGGIQSKELYTENEILNFHLLYNQ